MSYANKVGFFVRIISANFGKDMKYHDKSSSGSVWQEVMNRRLIAETLPKAGLI